MTMRTENFFEAINDFNAMYRMPRVDWDIKSIRDRTEKFASILSEEVEEMGEIESMLEAEAPSLSILTALCDLYGDIMIYCASELVRHDINPHDILQIIMESNASKLGADGKPIYDERGKLMKGPNYWKPEPRIHELLERQLAYRIAEKNGE